jgi:succinate dehydrogenase flavin-adding protein (antitoxin of CptAB toxin-antitoxin module)
MDRAEKNRLYWKCRRGLLELDLVFERFLKSNSPQGEEIEVLNQLLDLPDNDLWDLVSGRCDPLDARHRATVERLRAC